MLVFNTTYTIEADQEELFLIWLKEYYMPEVAKKDILRSPRLLKVLSHHDAESACYSLQFEVDNSTLLHSWHLTQGRLLNDQMLKIFKDKVVGFPTLMEVID